LSQANRPLASLIDSRIGTTWRRNLDELSALRELADEPEFNSAFRLAKTQNKRRLADLIARECHVTVDPDSLFDVQVKRMHEYKRQLLNVLHVVTRYQQILAHPTGNWVPRTVIFAGKAASAYYMAKLIIRLINDVAREINNDPRVNDKLKVVFIPNYRVSLAELIIPAADLSEQISTAGTEASGTGNMKFALNGALDHRHLGRGQHRDGRKRGVGQHLHFRQPHKKLQSYVSAATMRVRPLNRFQL
jgi:starch phosphorylase